MLVEAIIIILTVYTIINLWNNSSNGQWKNNNLPPSPSRLPIIGNIHHVIGKKIPIHQTFTELSKKLGSVFTFWFGDRPVVFVNDYHVAKELLLSSKCDGRPQREAGKTVSRNFQGLIVTDEEVAVEKRRAHLHQALKFHERGQFIKNLQIESDHLTNIIKSKLTRSNIIDITDDLALSANNIFMQLLFNKRFTTTDGSFATLQQLLLFLMKGLTLSNLMEGFPALRSIPLGRFMFLNYYVKGMFKIIGEEYDKHIKTFNNKKKSDLTDLLISKGDCLTRGNVEVLLSDTLVAGIDTTSNSLKLIVYNLAKYSNESEKCRHEIDELTKKKDEVSLDIIQECHYTRAFVYESLRKNSITPMGVPHRTTTDVYVEGYTIPRNTTIFFNIHSMHSDEVLFDKPSLFKPERFLNENGEYRNIEGFMGFSAGRRSCIGQTLAVKSLMFLVIELIRQFDFILPESEQKREDFEYETTLKMDNFNAQISERKRE